MITQDELKELFTYCEKTGNLIYKIDVGIKIKAGAIAGYTNKGYNIVTVNYQKYMAHRLIWIMLHSSIDSKLQVDHISGERGDNRISNLRLVTHQNNSKNQKLPKSNKSGVIGVCWDKRESKWRATVRVDGKQKHLGCFTNKEDAIKVRQAAEIEYGFHENHGRG